MAYPERLRSAEEMRQAAARFTSTAAWPREPLSRILGEREFWSLSLAVTPAVLDPRGDSETLVEAVSGGAAGAQPEARRLLDLGTGSGCLLSGALERAAQGLGLGVDLSFDAVKTARENARRLGLAERRAFLQASWCDALKGPWDVIVSNPPYIASRLEDIAGLEPEVRCHDPLLALDGGPDGLAAYRALRARVPCAAWRPMGCWPWSWASVRLEAVTALLRGLGCSRIESRRDLAGITRCLLAWP